MTLALRLYGYTTHQQLQQGEYDWRDRTYSLAETDLNLDLSAFWVVRQLQPYELTRAAIDLAILRSSPRAPFSPFQLGQVCFSRAAGGSS